MKGVKHYKKDGTEHKGSKHKMSDGTMHTNQSHTKTSVKLFHLKDLSVKAKAKAKDGGSRVRAGTSKGDSYCARSLGIKKGLSKKKQNDPNTPNNLSRKRWKCSGAKSKK